MSFVAGEVDGAAENIEHAAVDVRTLYPTKPLVHPLRILSLQIAHAVVAEPDEVLRHARPDARDGPQIVHEWPW